MYGKLLVIEDDQVLAGLLQLMMEREGFIVASALDGAEGLKKAKEESPDLVILDIMMPGMDGYEVCRHLRADPQTAHLPILMLTARERPRDRNAGFEAGADDYLTKPFVLSELVSRIKSLLFFADRVP